MAERRRTAIYTRKSSEEGLEQDFNSLDAQREACEAYIRSQASEGWQLVRAQYDDGGFSGGSIDRPALERLLADVEAGKIDTIVVYKVDRLTRSLIDFAKIVEVLDARGASFVSVTQQFNTTTSMGRLTLNMLLSFAQFEREVTGERIRDKIAASKRRGLWMGGYVPLGYEPQGRTLVVVESEAETVRTLFRLYLELGSVWRVKEEADRLGLLTKRRRGSDRRMHGGRSFTRGHIYQMLSNPLYVGRIAHNGTSHPGQHPGIIDLETWEAAQRQLTAQAPTRRKKTGASPSPLKGKLFDENGRPLTPSYTVRASRRYRYYVTPDQGSAPKDRHQRWRLPAHEIEKLVEDGVAALLANPLDLANCARNARLDEAEISELVERAPKLRGVHLSVVHRVDLSAAEIALQIDLSQLLGTQGQIVRHTMPVRAQRRGTERRLVLGDGAVADTRVDEALVKAVARGRRWFEALASGRIESLAEIAAAEGVSARYVAHLIPLAFLAPKIIAAILSGTQPTSLTAEVLTKRIDIPLAWAPQRERLGFD